MPEAIMKALATITEPTASDDAPYGGFTAILSAPSRDRDGDELRRDEWKTPLPQRITLDVDHLMTAEGTIGSARPYFDGDNLMIDAKFASTERAQLVRTLISEGHLDSVSVAFMSDHDTKSNSSRRELLNAAVVGIPSNRDAKILSAKAFEVITAAQVKAAAKDDEKPYGDVEYADPGYLDSEGKPAEDGKGQHRYPLDTEEHVRSAWSFINQEKNADQYTSAQLGKIKDKIKAAAEKYGIEIAEDDDKKSLGDRIAVLEQAIAVKAGARNSASDAKYLQAAHDALVLCGADCVTEAAPSDADGSAEGANKSVSSLVIGKGFAGSVEDMQCRVQSALNDACGAGDWDGTYPWIVATYLNEDGSGGSVVYRSGSETLCRAFSDDGTTVALDSVIQAVSVVTSVAPIPDTVDGDPTPLPPAAAEASKSVATFTTEPSGGTSNLPMLSAEIRANGTMKLHEFRAALDAIPGLSERHIICSHATESEVDAKSSGPAGSGSPESPVEADTSTPPDSKAAPAKGPADDEPAGVEADTETAEDEAQEKGIDPELLLADIYAASIRAMNLAS